MMSHGIGRLWRDGFVERVRPAPSPAHIFAQQMMALTLQEGGIANGDWRWWFDNVLTGVDQMAEGEVVAHMLERRILAEDGGVIGLGPDGEEAFGRRHFQELVAAFTTPLLLAVRHGNVDLGSIDPLSIEGQRTSVPLILLGACSWRVLDVDWPRRVASVELAAGEGRSPVRLGTRPRRRTRPSNRAGARHRRHRVSRCQTCTCSSRGASSGHGVPGRRIAARRREGQRSPHLDLRWRPRQHHFRTGLAGQGYA
jgi:hypothetical protein